MQFGLFRQKGFFSMLESSTHGWDSRILTTFVDWNAVQRLDSSEIHSRLLIVSELTVCISSKLRFQNVSSGAGPRTISVLWTCVICAGTCFDFYFEALSDCIWQFTLVLWKVSLGYLVVGLRFIDEGDPEKLEIIPDDVPSPIPPDKWGPSRLQVHKTIS